MNKLAILKHMRNTAEASKEFVKSLIGELSGTVADVFEEFDGVKADKSSAVAFVIPAEGWEADDTAKYPNYYDIEAAEVTVRDKVEITIAPGGLDIAKRCGLCPTNESMDGIIRVRSASIPEEEIAAEYWVEQGLNKERSDEEWPLEV